MEYMNDRHIDDTNETEVLSAHDDSDIKIEAEIEYEENWWPKDEEPNRFTFKSKKKVFGKAVKNV